MPLWHTLPSTSKVAHRDLKNNDAQPAHVARVYFSGSRAQPTDKPTNRRFPLCRCLLIYIIFSYIIVQVDMYINNNIIYINIKGGERTTENVCLSVCRKKYQKKMSEALHIS